MRILAIETSCDETAAAVVVDGRTIESNVVSTQIEAHRLTGGVVPEVAARMQMEAMIPVVEQALADANKHWNDVDAIAVTFGPGLVGSLLVGLETAKALALSKDKPLIPVNHLAGHLYACLQDEEPFRFPYLGLIVSGGHTEFVVMPNHHTFQIVGSTRDDAAGEAFDKVGKLLGLPYPGGPEISRLAKAGNPEAIPFPRAMLDQDNLGVSFSGLKTAASREVTRLSSRAERSGVEGSLSDQKRTGKKGISPLATLGRNDNISKADIAACFQAAVVDTLVRKSRSALRRYPTKAFLLGGGVAANPALRDAMKKMLSQEDVELLVSPPKLSTDNAAMIGLAAYWQQDQALTSPKLFSVGAEPRASLASPVA